jgi:PilZ domain
MFRHHGKANPALPAAANRRSAGLIMLTVPLRVSGVDANGMKFTCPAKTVSVNRHRARVELGRPLSPGATLRLTNLLSRMEAEFHVIGFLGSGLAGVAEWDVAAVDPKLDFWGIYFPSAGDSTRATTALAECRQCRLTALLKVSESEADVLATGARISRRCPKCEAQTTWSSAERAVPQVSAAAPAPLAAKGPERRHPRHCVQRPLTIRDSSGAIEKTRTENVSQGGLCCTSERTYETGQKVALSWPHDSKGGTYEVQARVVRRHDIGGSTRKIYGLEYESPPVLLPPRSLSSRGLYWAFGALVGSAAALAGAAVAGLASTIESPSRNWQPSFDLAAVLLLLYFANRARRASARMEPDLGEGWRRHRIAGGLAALALSVAIIAGAGMGLRQSSLRAQHRQLLVDLSLARTLERRIDTEESRKPGSSQDYSDLCATLQPLAGEWERPLARLNDDLAGQGSASAGENSLAEQLQSLGDMVALDREKLRVIMSQIALASVAARLPDNQQLVFWQSNFDPLQEKYQQLNVRREAMIASFPGR